MEPIGFCEVSVSGSPEEQCWPCLDPMGPAKTTIVRILSTLLRPDGGQVRVEGHDVVSQTRAVQKVIGLTGQSAAVDEFLTGRENLVMMGRLYRLTKASSQARAQELLDEFDLAAQADKTVKTYSGGLRRRLDLAVQFDCQASSHFSRRTNNRARPPIPPGNVGHYHPATSPRHPPSY